MGQLKNILGSGLLLCASGLVHAAALPAQQATTATTTDRQAATSAQDAQKAQAQQPTATTPAGGQATTAQPPTPATGAITAQPSAIIVQPPAAGAQPSTIIVQPPATGAQPSTIIVQPPATGAQPSTIIVQPPATGGDAGAAGAAAGVILPGVILQVPATAASPAMSVALPAPAAAAAVYVPKTPFDNTPHRFNMTQGGRRMSANDFDSWMRAKGYRVARGRPPGVCPKAPPPGVQTVVGPDGCPVEISIELGGVTFDFAKASLRPEAKKILDQAVEILKRHPELTVEVAGHTDSRGDAAFNQKLSESRAKAVYDYLVEKGVDRRQLLGPIGYGESKPIASNHTDAGRNQNRRTELNIKAVAALPAPAGAVTVAAAPVVVPAGGSAAPQTAAPAIGTAPAPVPAGTPAPVPVVPPAGNTGAAPAPAAKPATVPPDSPSEAPPPQQPTTTPPGNS